MWRVYLCPGSASRADSVAARAREIKAALRTEQLAAPAPLAEAFASIPPLLATR